MIVTRPTEFTHTLIVNATNKNQSILEQNISM